MGNCIGKGGGAREGVSRAPAAPANGIFNRDVLLMQAEHLAATASSAHFASSQVQKTYSTIHKPSTDTLLLAFFEGVGASIGGHRTAALANSLLCETFTESFQRYGDNPEAILRATLQAIHHRCLASPKIPHKQPAGASGTLVLLNLTTGHCTVANIGHSRCLLAGVSGSFNSKRPQCTWISTLHTTENLKERMHAARHSSSDDKGAYFDITLPLQPPFADNLETKESVFVTRALGMVSEGSRSDSQGRGGAAHDVEVAVSSFYLFPAQDHIVIGSSGFWDLLAPSAVALRSHLFSKFQQAQKEAVQAALNNDAPVPSPAERGPQAAEHLVRFALGTTADRLSTRTGTMITATDLEELPFQRDKISTEDLHLGSLANEGAAAGVNATSGGQGSDLNLPQPQESQQMTPNGSLKVPQSQEQLPKELSLDDLIRSDIHKDLGCVVLSLSWRQKGPQENPNPPPRIFHPTFHPKRPSEVLNQGYYASDLAPLARFRWAQVRMLVDYHRLYKREVMQRWGEVVQGIVGKAKIRAKAVAERVKSEHGIAVQVTPLMKVKAMDGRPLSADLFNIKASINF